jgi:hypothetical protein
MQLWGRLGNLTHTSLGLSQRAGMMARYLDEREGYCCGDQGHDAAVKAMNKAGKIIYMKAFGYNAFHDLNF